MTKSESWKKRFPSCRKGDKEEGQGGREGGRSWESQSRKERSDSSALSWPADQITQKQSKSSNFPDGHFFSTPTTIISS